MAFALFSQPSDLIRFVQPTFHSSNMPNIAANSLRQASRLCLKPAASKAGLLRASTHRVAAISAHPISRRGYVSESKKDNAQVSVETAIRADQKQFFAETGKLPQDEIVPGTSTTADAMMSPMAGTYPSYLRKRANADEQ